MRAYARKVAAGVGKLTVPLNEMCAWPWGYNNTFLSEYYLATGDQEVLHAISEYAITSARGQSWCGTYGHGMAWPKPDGSSTHGIVPPYGALNQAGLLVSIGIVLGDKCGIKDPEIAPAIERSRRYFGYFAGNPLIYTWSKVRGAGPVTFSPNGTSASSNSTAALTIPGSYLLKLTVSDALLGDTEGYGGVSTNLTVKFKDGRNVTDRPPAATPQSVTLAEDTSKAIKVNDGTADSEPATVAFSMGGLAAGIFSEFYQWPDLSSPEPWPDMASRQPDTTRIDAKMQLAAAEFPPNYEDHFCSRHTGYLKIVTAGDYQFSISADDHAKLWVDGKLAIEQYYSKKGWNAGALPLSPGYHEFKLEYMESYGGNYVNLSWAGPGVSGGVPAGAFFHLTSGR